MFLSTFRKQINYKVKLHPAARYFLYYKQLEHLMQFYDGFSAQSITYFAGLREIINSINEMIENAQSNNLSDTQILTKQEGIVTIIKKMMSDNQDFAYSECQKMTDDLTNDLNNFSKIIENPQANSLNHKFKPFIKKRAKLENQLSQFPDQWITFMVDYANKAYIDFIIFSLKNRLVSKIEKAHQDFEILVESNIHNNLILLEQQVISIDEKSIFNKTNLDVFSANSGLLTQSEDIFNNLIREIHLEIKELPESIEIAGNNYLEDGRAGGIENINEYVVSLRKTADFYISNELCDQIKKQSSYIRQQLTQLISTIADLIRLANFNINQEKYSTPDDAENKKSIEQKQILIETILKSIKNEEYKLNEININLRNSFNEALKIALEPLSSVVIINTSISLNKKIRDTEKRRLYDWLQRINKNVSSSIISQLVKLQYSKSEGLLWARRLEQSHEKVLLFPGEPFKRMLEKISPDKILMQQLPFYYANLFSGKSSLSEDFWVGMDEEIEKGSRAIKSFLNGASGMVIITGERSSGKSSLSKHIARLHFKKQNTYVVKAPKESIADKELFEQTLLNSLGGQKSLQYSMDMLHEPIVIIIDDLELWWQRKPSGTQVVERIISLMQQYSHKALFIVNVNKYALKIINQLSSLNSWAIDLVFCQPLDAHELKDLILTRHLAGGLKFILYRKHEDEMTNLDYALLFNSFFNLSSGNPGYTLNLWLACIRKIEGNTIVLEKPTDKEISFPENLQQDEIIYILQFILHRRFSINKLSEVLQNDIESTEKAVRMLLQKGILVEKFPGVFALNPALEIHLVKKLKSLELL